jgi:cytochrome c6
VSRPLAAVALGLLVASAWAADPQHGAELYRRHCSACHGDAGRPRMAGAPDFTAATALMKTDLALAAAVRSGRGAMPAYAGLLRERELLDLVAHLRTLR